MVTMDMSHFDSAGYLGVLVFVNLFYLSLIILLTWIVVRVRNNQDFGGLYNTQSRQVGNRVLFANFIFLQLCLLFKLITAVIFLIHVIGLSGSHLPILLIRLFYHSSCLFLCVAYAISLYIFIFMAMRVNLYGGKFGVRDFKQRVLKSKKTFTGVSSVIFICTLALILVESFYTSEQMT